MNEKTEKPNDEMEEAFRRMRTILATRIGESSAITIDDLAKAAGLSRVDKHGALVPLRRSAEQILEERFAEFPFLLVSGARGYYRPSHAGELQRYYNSLRSRLVKLCLRQRTLRAKAATCGFVRQDGTWAQAAQAAQVEMPYFTAPGCRAIEAEVVR